MYNVQDSDLTSITDPGEMLHVYIVLNFEDILQNLWNSSSSKKKVYCSSS